MIAHRITKIRAMKNDAGLAESHAVRFENSVNKLCVANVFAGFWVWGRTIE
jgi:hypothetical protein